MIEQNIALITWFAIGWILFGCALVILLIGRPRDPYTPVMALFTALFNGGIAALIFYLARQAGVL